MERRKKEMETEEEVDEEKPREKRQGRWGQEGFKEWPVRKERSERTWKKRLNLV